MKLGRCVEISAQLVLCVTEFVQGEDGDGGGNAVLDAHFE
jgi:hypothetical protein